MSHYLNFDPSTVEPEEGAPAADRLVSGDPRFTTWNLEEAAGGIYAGIWQSTPGKWRISYDEWEFCHIISGEAELTNEDGKSWRFRKGDAFIIPAGFKGAWETKKKVKKHYVILLPKG